VRAIQPRSVAIRARNNGRTPYQAPSVKDDVMAVSRRECYRRLQPPTSPERVAITLSVGLLEYLTPLVYFSRGGNAGVRCCRPFWALRVQRKLASAY